MLSWLPTSFAEKIEMAKVVGGRGGNKLGTFEKGEDKLGWLTWNVIAQILLRDRVRIHRCKEEKQEQS